MKIQGGQGLTCCTPQRTCTFNEITIKLDITLLLNVWMELAQQHLYDIFFPIAGCNQQWSTLLALFFKPLDEWKRGNE